MKTPRLRRNASLALTLLLIAGLSACDAELQDSPEAMSLTARGATEVMPEDAIAVGMIDLKSLAANPLTTPFGEAGFFTSHLQGEARARFDDFTAATGLDPETDLSEVYAGLVAVEGQNQHPAVNFAIYGTFDREALQNFVESRLGSDLTQRDYAGVTVFEKAGEHGGIAFALASDQMIVAASGYQDVTAMLDRLQGQGTSIADNKDMMARIARAAAAGDVWGVALKPSEMTAPNGSEAIENQLGRLVTAVQAAGGALDVQPASMATTMQIYPSDGVSADDLASLVRGAIAMARAQDGLDDDKRSMLDDVKVAVERDYVTVRFEAPNAFFESMAKN